MSSDLAELPLYIYWLVPSVVPEFIFKVSELATLDALAAVPVNGRYE